MYTRLIAALFLIVMGVTISVPVRASSSSVVISEIVFSDEETVGNIKLFNPTEEAVSLEGWVMEYAKPGAFAASDSFDCSAAHWSISTKSDDASSDIEEIALAGSVAAGKSVSVAFDQPVSPAGSLRIISSFDDTNRALLHDLVGWTAGDAVAVCSEGKPAAADGVMKRSTDVDGLPIDSNDNRNDFTESLDPEPLPCPIDLMISELFPSPRSGISPPETEFVELYNPTDSAMQLDSCALRRGDKAVGDKTWHELEGSLGPGEYLVVKVGFTLLNSSRVPLEDGNDHNSVVVLLDRNEPVGVIDASQPYKSVPAGKSWTLLGDVWAITEPTRGLENPIPEQSDNQEDELDQEEIEEVETTPCPEGKYRNPLTNRCRKIEVAVASLTPCDEDEQRNPVTNRCRKVATVAETSLAACRTGYERNPETNRCRKIGTVASSSTLTPCREGQERNPETNRCRKITGSNTGVKPCQSGQERNPETNRCRKIVSETSQPIVTEAKTDKSDETPVVPAALSGWFIGLAMAGVIGYGLYEWRDEAVKGLVALKARFAKKR